MSSRTNWSSLLVLLVLLVPHAALAAAGGLPALEATVASLQATVNNLNSQLTSANGSIAALQAQLATANASITTLQGQVAELKDKLQYVSIETGPINGLAGPHVIFTGANVHIRSGSLATDDSGTPLGLGNLIVGYNEEPDHPGLASGDRGGSHNLVVGRQHRYLSTGGLVAGVGNTISGPSATVTGGGQNTASGKEASVTGGGFNTASGEAASVGGGSFNTASGFAASVSGGQSRSATGDYNWVAGGLLETN